MGIFSFFLGKKTPPPRSPAIRAPVRLAKRSLEMGKDHRLLGDWNVQESTPDQAIFMKAEKMRARAQDLEKNDDMIRRFLNVMCNKCIGPDGITYQARAREAGGALDLAANKLLELAHRKAGKVGQYDVTRMLSRIDGQNLALRRLLVDGEYIKRYWPGFDNKSKFAVEFIDPARLDIQLNQEPGENRNRIVMGVEKDSFGAPIAYHFLPANQGPYGNLLASRSGRHQVIAAEFIRHVFIVERPGQSRGITWLYSGGARKKLLDGLEEAAVVAARVAAAKMGFFSAKGEEYEGQGTDADGATIMEAEAGGFEQLGPNMELLEWKPEFPPSDVSTLVKNFKKGISSGLNVSYHTLASDLEGVNYTSSRTGELSDRAFYRCIQTFIIEHDCELEHEAWTPMAFLSGLVRLPIEKLEKFLAAEFWGCSWDWTDPVKQHAAQVLQHQLGRSLHSIHRENGWDYDEEMELRGTEPNLGPSATLAPTPEKPVDEEEETP